MSLTIRKLTPARRSTTLYHLQALIIIFSLLLAGFSPAVASPADDFNAPNPISPAEGQVYTATGESGSQAAPPVAIPAFSWGGVAGAATYRIQISQDIAFTTKLEATTPLTRWTPTNVGQFNDGPWYWRVRVESPSPGSNYSLPVGFSREWASPNNRPLLNSPAEGANLEFLDASTFQWSPVLGAARYRFQISSSMTFAILAYNQLTLAAVHQPLTKLAEGTYYWRVIPLDPANREGTSSEIRSFTQLYNQVPTLIEPADDSFPTFTPTFHWQAVRGAQFYRLQYSTDPSFNANVSTIDTRNTQFTPTATLPNDVNYYWRVRTVSGQSLSNWSEVWNFQKRWYLQASLLTPTNLYQLARFPFFSWTPVPGAARYKIEYNTHFNTFPPTNGETAYTANPFYTFQRYSGSADDRYWRVTPIDANNNEGKPSQVFSFYSFQEHDSSPLIYPLYYYPSDAYQAFAQFQPHEDRTAPIPVFQWNRVLDVYSGTNVAPAYRIQVSASPIFAGLDWWVDTKNLVAAPIAADGFTPDPNTDYYWRVCPLDSLGGACLLDSGTTPLWSQVWKARFNASLLPAPTSGSGPELLRPVDLYEYGEITPLLEWLPFQGADGYEVQISRFANFSPILDSTIVTNPAYAPTTSFAQRSLNQLDFGAFYWRVRARSGGAPLGTWSETRRFLIAAHSQWQATRILGDSANRLQISIDTAGDVADANYDLTSLQAAQDSSGWYFGFHANTTATNMSYVLYIDLDHTENSGANSDAQGFTISTSPAFRPEFAIYVHQSGGTFQAANAYLYHWDNGIWVLDGSLLATGGGLDYDIGNNYVEIKVSNTGIGMGQDTGSYALALFSVNPATGLPQDSVPANPGIPGTNLLTHFASVTERMTASQPPNHTPNDTQHFSSLPPFFWEYPEVAPWAGVSLEVYLDPGFTTKIASYLSVSNAPYYAENATPWSSDLSGDNTYYWRLRPRYLVGNTPVLGAWSQGSSLIRTGFIPTNLSESVTFATPTFSWDMVEGALNYDLQVDNDPAFGSLALNVTTAQNEYTPTNPIPNGTYYWRVRMRRHPNVTNEWSPAEVFTLSYPTPAGLTPHDPLASAVLNRAPTLCWTPLIASQGGVPTLAAYKYRVQVSFGDPTFSTTYETVDTEQACYTPSKGYQDGKYYWRVAMLDGNNNLGPFSPAAEFTKQYPMANLVYPTSGDSVLSTPTFKWTVVSGAASYRLEISKNSTFSPLYDSITTSLVEYTPLKFYDLNQTYFWRVAIIDAEGKYGPFNNEIIILDPLGSQNKVFLPLMRKN